MLVQTTEHQFIVSSPHESVMKARPESDVFHLGVQKQNQCCYCLRSVIVSLLPGFGDNEAHESCFVVLLDELLLLDHDITDEDDLRF